ATLSGNGREWRLFHDIVIFTANWRIHCDHPSSALSANAIIRGSLVFTESFDESCLLADSTLLDFDEPILQRLSISGFHHSPKFQYQFASSLDYRALLSREPVDSVPSGIRLDLRFDNQA